MQDFLAKIDIRVNENIYLKDPRSSDLGRRIISGSIDLIDEIGFEGITFRKLGRKINSPEASVYRYFQSKHKLLLYIISWYWRWMEYRLVFGLANIESPAVRLKRAIGVLTEQVQRSNRYSYIDEQKLHRIIISEASKAYLTKDVDKENKEGFFTGYQQVVALVSNIILEINPDYKYPRMLVSTVIEGAHHEHYFAKHLPKLTNTGEGKMAVEKFYTDLTATAIGLG